MYVLVLLESQASPDDSRFLGTYGRSYTWRAPASPLSTQNSAQSLAPSEPLISIWWTEERKTEQKRARKQRTNLIISVNLFSTTKPPHSPKSKYISCPSTQEGSPLHINSEAETERTPFSGPHIPRNNCPVSLGTLRRAVSHSHPDPPFQSGLRPHGFPETTLVKATNDFHLELSNSQVLRQTL